MPPLNKKTQAELAAEQIQKITFLEATTIKALKKIQDLEEQIAKIDLQAKEERRDELISLKNIVRRIEESIEEVQANAPAQSSGGYDKLDLDYIARRVEQRLNENKKPHKRR